MCRVEVESCYEGREDDLGCVNPEFHELPLGEPSFRIFAQVRAERLRRRLFIGATFGTVA